METKIKVVGHIKNELASLYHVTPEYVAMVIRGKRHNKAITDAYAFMSAEADKAKQALAKMKATKK